MIRFLVDEDMSRSTAEALNKAGFDCLDVRDLGLRGSPDTLIYRKAQEESCIILTRDLGFSNSLRFPPREPQRDYHCEIPERNVHREVESDLARCHHEHSGGFAWKSDHH